MAAQFTRLSHADLTALTSAVKDLYAHSSLASLPDKMLSLVAGLVSCEITTYDEWIFDSSCHAAAYRLIQRPFSESVSAIMPALATHIHEHPLFPAFQKEVSVPVKISDFLTTRQFKECSVFQEAYRHLGIYHQMAYFLPKAGNTRVCFVLNRSKKDFSERDRQMLAHISPHLRQAHTNAVALDGLRQCERMFHVEERETFQLNTAGRPQYLSPRAAIWLRNYFADNTSADHWPRTFFEWIWRQIAPGRNDVGVRKPLVIQKNLSRLTITVFQNPGGGATVLLVEVRPKTFAEISSGLPLSERENEIFRWICQAKTNPEIAAILGLSVRTVHKHTQRILDKLGVENRLQAQRLGWEMQMS